MPQELRLMYSLKDKVALVTGASRGIGFAIAECLGRTGATVILNGRSPDQLATSVEILQARGHAAEGKAFDATEEVSVSEAIGDIGTRYGRLDILVNNAGIVLAKDVFETSLEDWCSVIGNNLTSAFLCSQAALRMMRDTRSGGRIIMIGSTAGQRGSPSGAVAYSASKAGLTGLAQTLAFTGASFGVTVNVVAPGMILTDMLRQGFGPRLEDAAKKVPLGVGDPTDVAQAVLYLASDAARYVTGTTVDVNGGLNHR